MATLTSRRDSATRPSTPMSPVGRLHLDLDAGRLVAGAQQQAQQHEVRDDRGSAVAHERQRHAGERDEPGHASDDDERLQPDRRGQSGGGERGHVGAGARCRREPAQTEHGVGDDERGAAQKPDLLADRREDEVGLDRGDATGESPSDAHSRHATGSEREERLHELVAAAGGVGERVEPDVDARLHVSEREVRGRRADREEHEAHDHVADAPRRRVDHHEEDPEEQQARAQVLLGDEHEQRDGPHEQQRPELLERRHPDAQDAPRRDRQQFAVLGEVGGEEEHDEDLGDLAGLERQRSETKPELRAVHLAADEGGQHEQRDRREHDRVLVAREGLERAHRHERRHEYGHADEQPHDLASSEGGVEAGDEREAHAGEQRGDRKQRRVGSRGSGAYGDVGDGESKDQSSWDDEVLERDRLGGLRLDEREDEQNDRCCGQQKKKLQCSRAAHLLRTRRRGRVLARRVGTRRCVARHALGKLRAVLLDEGVGGVEVLNAQARDQPVGLQRV